jgi:bacteriophage HK97-gp10 putative tail-component
MATKHIGIEMTGVAELQRLIRELGPRAVQAAESALYQEAETILAASKELVPVDTGTLRASGHVTLPERSGDVITVLIGYGGPAAPYAVHVHENLGAHHAQPTQAKYLEQPALEAVSGMDGRMAETVRQALEGGAHGRP